MVQLCLHDQDADLIDNRVACHQGHPVQGRYPTRAWETGYIIRDEISLILPPCLPSGSYQFSLALLPLRTDSTETVIESPAQTIKFLETVDLSPLQGDPSQTKLCIQNECYTQGTIALEQLRQTITLIEQATSPLNRPTLRLEAGADGLHKSIWKSLPNLKQYICPDGRTVQARYFILDPSVQPGRYRFSSDKINLSLDVKTRKRTFHQPKNIQTRIMLSPDSSQTVSSPISFGPKVTLLGYDLDQLPRWPGDSIAVMTYWQANQVMREHYIGSLHLLDHTMTMWGQHDQYLGGPYLSVLWAPGEVVQDFRTVPIGQHVPPGLYQLELSLYDYTREQFEVLPRQVARTQEPLEYNPILGQIRILDTAHHHQTKIVKLGGEITFLGYWMPRRL